MEELMSITLTAANDLFVEFDADRWMLFASGMAEPGFVATQSGMQYVPAFATARQLSAGGLTPEQVTMVVVGWSGEDSSWHLGLLLDAEFTQATQRGGRWCELARWTTVSGQDAEQAGRKLALIIGRPFRLVLPDPSTAAAEAIDSTKVTPSTVTTQPLPLHFGEWTVGEVMGGMEWARTGRWRRDQILRGLFFGVLTPVFGLLAFGAILSPYASVQPEWLPVIGVALSAVMLYNAIMSFTSVLRSPTTSIDRRISVIRQTRRSSQKMTQVPFEALEYGLITHSIVRKQVADPERLVAVMEVWVHVYSPRRGFILICSSENVEGFLLRGLDLTTRRPLDLNEINTPAHHAAAHLMEDIGISFYAEER
jgi:hypothetical protein